MIKNKGIVFCTVIFFFFLLALRLNVFHYLETLRYIRWWLKRDFTEFTFWIWGNSIRLRIYKDNFYFALAWTKHPSCHSQTKSFFCLPEQMSLALFCFRIYRTRVEKKQNQNKQKLECEQEQEDVTSVPAYCRLNRFEFPHNLNYGGLQFPHGMSRAFASLLWFNF